MARSGLTLGLGSTVAARGRSSQVVGAAAGAVVTAVDSGHGEVQSIAGGGTLLERHLVVQLRLVVRQQRLGAGARLAARVVVAAKQRGDAAA